jgi:hypothetical protein
MNTIEVYKKLPGQNCGDCPQNTCMAFALAIVKGEADPSECPLLSDDEIQALASAKGEDWKKNLITTLRNDLKQIDFKNIYRRIGADFRNGSIFLRCLGTEYEVRPDGEIYTGGYINPWLRILILHYIITAGIGDPSGDWVSFSELKSGMVKESSFIRDCEEPLRDLLDTGFEVTSGALQMLGARPAEHAAADHSWLIDALPRVPMLILYWRRDEDEPETGGSRVKILFDRTADRFLDVESLIFLVEGMIHLINYMSRQEGERHR